MGRRTEGQRSGRDGAARGRRPPILDGSRIRAGSDSARWQSRWVRPRNAAALEAEAIRRRALTDRVRNRLHDCRRSRRKTYASRTGRGASTVTRAFVSRNPVGAAESPDSAVVFWRLAAFSFSLCAGRFVEQSPWPRLWGRMVGWDHGRLGRRLRRKRRGWWFWRLRRRSIGRRRSRRRLVATRPGIDNRG